jgi:hypothetical protein
MFAVIIDVLLWYKTSVTSPDVTMIIVRKGHIKSRVTLPGDRWRVTDPLPAIEIALCTTTNAFENKGPEYASNAALLPVHHKLVNAPGRAPLEPHPTAKCNSMSSSRCCEA